MNEGLKMGSCSHESATEGSVDVVVVNKRFVEDVLFTGEWLADVSMGGGCERRA